MNNGVILKWGSLKAYWFDDKFTEKNKEIVNEINEIWVEIYNNGCGAVLGSQYLQSNEQLKIRLVSVLEKLYELGVPFQNGFTDEYYNSFEDIKDYIMRYGV